MTVLVSPGWLRLREPADAAARSAALAARVARGLDGPLEIHDLGGGSGAMGRWLAPRLPGPQHWVIHDRDDSLLDLALAEPPHGATVEARHTELGRLTRDDLAGADVVVASALLDILTGAELDAIARAAAGRPLLLALNVTGRVELAPADPLDARFMTAFNAHQRRDGKLGPDAVTALPGSIARPSPWRLGGGDRALISEWLDGWIAAACEQEPALAVHAAGYRDRRLAAADLAVTVHHADLLVAP